MLIFFGRGREIDNLIYKSERSKCRFIAVVGASGSGKSSLVAAGLLPALEKNAIHGSKDWVWGRFTPGEVGDNPFMALASAFKPTLERNGLRPRDMAAELEKDAGSFNKFLAMALEGKPDWAELLLFIDQFEELFTLVDKKYQSPFVDLWTGCKDATGANGGDDAGRFLPPVFGMARAGRLGHKRSVHASGPEDWGAA